MLRMEGSNGLKAMGELLLGSKGQCGLQKGWAVCLEWPSNLNFLPSPPLARGIRKEPYSGPSHPAPHKWQFKSQSQPSSDICFLLNTPGRRPGPQSLFLMKNTTRKIGCSSWGAVQRQQGRAPVGMVACVPQDPDDMSQPGSGLQGLPGATFHTHSDSGAGDSS